MVVSLFYIIVYQDLSAFYRFIRVVIIFIVSYVLLQINHDTPLKLNSSTLLIYCVTQLAVFEGTFKRESENRLIAFNILIIVQ